MFRMPLICKCEMRNFLRQNEIRSVVPRIISIVKEEMGSKINNFFCGKSSGIGYDFFLMVNFRSFVNYAICHISKKKIQEISSNESLKSAKYIIIY